MTNKTPKVCMLQPYLSPYRMGLFNALSDRLGGRLTILYFSKEEAARKWSFERNVRFQEVHLKADVTGTGYDSTRVRLSFLSLAGALRRLRPDVVIANEGLPARMIRLLQPVLRFKLIFWTEGTEVVLGGVRPNRWLVRWLDRGVSAYVIPGKLSAQYLRNVRAYCGPVYFAPNTIDRTLFACTAEEVRQRFAEEPVRILFSGSLIPRKGIASLQEALERLAKTPSLPAYRFDVLGTGPVEQKAAPQVTYHGYKTQEECAAFMKRAHIFVLPSLWDCNPLVTAEATAAGCVTVLSDGVGNWPEYTDGNGLVFARGSADALYEALVRVLRMERSERLKLAEKSLQIASRVSHENSAEVFARAIQDVAR